MQVLYDRRWQGNHGIGRYAREIYARLSDYFIPLQSGPKPSSPWDPFWLSLKLASQKPRFFYSPGYNMPLYSSVPFMVTLHDIFHVRVAKEAGWLKQQYFERFIKQKLTQAERVFTVSEFSKQDILRWCPRLNPEKLIVTGNGCSAAFTPEGEKYLPGYRYFLYVGNRKQHKNIPGLLQAFAEVSKALPEVKLLMTGVNDSEIGKPLMQYQLEQQVLFIDSPSDEALASYYRGCEALVMPSLYEGFGVPVIEAQACGVPVITSNVTSLPEVAGEGAILVSPTDSTALAQAMQMVFVNSALKAELRVKGLENVKRYTWEAIVDKILPSLRSYQ